MAQCAAAPVNGDVATTFLEGAATIVPTSDVYNFTGPSKPPPSPAQRRQYAKAVAMLGENKLNWLY